MPEAKVKVRSKTQAVPPGSNCRVAKAPAAMGDERRLTGVDVESPFTRKLNALMALVDLLVSLSLRAVAWAKSANRARLTPIIKSSLTVRFELGILEHLL